MPFGPIEDLKHTRILVTNDDGIHAPGLEVLEAIARSLSDDVWVVAPETEQSGAGHSLSLNTPLRYRKLDERRYSVSGTPTDSVLMGVRAIVPQDKPIGLVLSGVNRGANVAEDITHSGTIAAAMEGTLCNIPSIALSQSFSLWEETATVNWDVATQHAPALISRLTKKGWPENTLMNMNFPNLAEGAQMKGMKVASHGKRDVMKQLTKAQDPKGRPYYWLTWGEEIADSTRPEADIKWIEEGYITVTPICLDLTDYKQMEMLRETLEA